MADFRQPVLDVVYITFQQYAREQTALHSATARLPAELLVDTFAQLDFRDRIRAATVCHRWRDVSLGFPARLWSTIPALDNLDAWAALLDRAGNALVTLERIYIDRRSFWNVYIIIRQHMHHIKQLDLRTPTSEWYSEDDDDSDDDDGRDGWLRYLDSILKLPAPALEAISVYFGEELPHPLQTLPILASPAVRTIKLHHARLSCLSSCAGSPALRTLVIDVEEEGFPVHDWSLVSSFPALEELSFRLDAPPPDNLSALSIDLPPTLRRLHLEIDDDLFRLLTNSLIPSLGRVPHWRISFTMGSLGTMQDLLPVFSGPFTDVAFRYSHTIDFMVTERTGEQRIVQNVYPDGNSGWLPVLADVERLSYTIIGTLPADMLNSTWSFGALRELTFDMSPARHLLDYVREVEWPYGLCPQLRTVQIRSHGRTTRVRIASIITVLFRLLDPTRQHRLSLLVFDNINILSETPLDTDADALSAFHQFAETVSMRSDGAAWPECRLVWHETLDNMAES